MSRIKTHCPYCNKPLVKRKGEFGSFWGCSGYPNCKFTCSIDFPTLNEKQIIKRNYDLNVSNKLALLLSKNKNENVVYFIKTVKDGYIKIGCTTNYISRLSALDTEHQGIVPILLIKTKFHRALESFLHQLFDEFLICKKEYFNIPPEYLIEIIKLKSFLGERVMILEKEKIELGKVFTKRYIIEWTEERIKAKQAKYKYQKKGHYNNEE